MTDTRKRLVGNLARLERLTTRNAGQRDRLRSTAASMADSTGRILAENEAAVFAGDPQAAQRHARALLGRARARDRRGRSMSDTAERHCPKCGAQVIRPAREGGLFLRSRYHLVIDGHDGQPAHVYGCPGCDAELEVREAAAALPAPGWTDAGGLMRMLRALG